MGSRSASLLTKTQRSRIQEGFADVDENKRRRDEQQIRERVRAGLLDFRVLAGYPDRQLDLATDDLSDEELRATLADATLFVERVRELRDVDRDEVVVRARGRAGRLAEGTGDAPTLDRLDLRTAAEIRNEAESSMRERFEPGRWDRRADALLRVAAGSAVVFVLSLVAEQLTAPDLLGTNALVALVYGLSLFAAAAALAAVFLIKFAQTCKHTLVPAVRALRRDPVGAVERLLDRLRRPGETLRESWEDL